ncbi:MAG: sel1 repeat family protein [Elusimicrobia bacterium]|nr:sel1 repeat family protein [Elusimicrobiota bacterium]
MKPAARSRFLCCLGPALWLGTAVCRAEPTKAAKPLEEARRLADQDRFDEAARKLQRPAQDGDLDAQVLLGAVYRRWQSSTPPDKPRPGYEKAVFWYFLAADHGSSEGQLGLAEYYWSIEGDYGRAVAWFQKAADAGNAMGTYNLGNAYAVGKGVRRDLDEARRSFQKAADRGLSPAMLRLALMYDNGEGVAKDASQAAAWYRKAAGHGETQAQLRLAAMHASGEGAQKDAVEAYAWALIASRQNTPRGSDPAAELLRSKLAKTLTPAELAEAEQRARAWRQE